MPDPDHLDPKPLLEDPRARVHFVGVGGDGMSALASYRVLGGGSASGSDRSFDQGAGEAARTRLLGTGVALHPQDGSGVEHAALLVASTAVEATVPDLMRAKELGVPVIHRSALLATWVAEEESIAVTGTCGKSTVTAMIFHILSKVSQDPGLLTGGPLRALLDASHTGNARVGSGPLVVEADESDGTVVRYQPEIGVILNLGRDHKEPEVVLKMFVTFKERARRACVISDDAALASLRPGSTIFGFGSDSDCRGTGLEVMPTASRFMIGDTPVRVPLSGVHNAINALGAVAACAELGVSVAEAAEALASFEGVARRFEVVGCHRGVEVVDDFAHNPEKIQAALIAAQGRAQRVHALFQPHGFGPTAFHRKALVAALAETLRSEDTLALAPIFYAGGTAARVISSDDLVSDLNSQGIQARVMERNEWARSVGREATHGDLLLIMGARDGTLPSLARSALKALTISSQAADSAGH